LLRPIYYTLPLCYSAHELRKIAKTQRTRSSRSILLLPEITVSSRKREFFCYNRKITAWLERRNTHGMPGRMCRLLHRRLDLVADPGHAERETGRRALRAVDGAKCLQAVREAGAARRMRKPSGICGDVRCEQRGSVSEFDRIGALDGTKFTHDHPTAQTSKLGVYATYSGRHPWTRNGPRKKSSPPRAAFCLQTYKRASSAFFSSSKPGLPSSANMFFLYASTPGWSNGLTPRR
jgi:hypothetical protein